jgi:hypothetical protein
MGTINQPPPTGVMMKAQASVGSSSRAGGLHERHAAPQTQVRPRARPARAGLISGGSSKTAASVGRWRATVQPPATRHDVAPGPLATTVVLRLEDCRRDNAAQRLPSGYMTVEREQQGAPVGDRAGERQQLSGSAGCHATRNLRRIYDQNGEPARGLPLKRPLHDAHGGVVVITGSRRPRRSRRVSPHRLRQATPSRLDWPIGAPPDNKDTDVRR